LIERNKAKKLNYPTKISDLHTSLKNDYRWVSSIIYTALAILSTSLVVYLLFDKSSSEIMICIGIYLVVIFFIVFLVSLSFLTKNYMIGYGVAQHFKNLIQTPIFSFIVIAIIWNYRKNKQKTFQT
jgi:ABC-type transport system involved in cytochrome c biogenesis permease subunit